MRHGTGRPEHFVFLFRVRFRALPKPVHSPIVRVRRVRPGNVCAKQDITMRYVHARPVHVKRIKFRLPLQFLWYWKILPQSVPELYRLCDRNVPSASPFDSVRMLRMWQRHSLAQYLLPVRRLSRGAFPKPRTGHVYIVQKLWTRSSHGRRQNRVRRLFAGPLPGAGGRVGLLVQHLHEGVRNERFIYSL